MNDRELIRQILSGNMNAFNFLVQKHQKLVAHMVYRIIHQREDVEDLCQEIFIKVYANLKHYRSESKLSTWIATIAYNASVTYIKKHSKTEQVEISTDEYELPASEGPNVLLEKADLKKLIKKQIEQLPEHYRIIITLYHLEEFSYKEIEEITGMPEGTIKTHLHRARKILKNKLNFVVKQEGVTI